MGEPFSTKPINNNWLNFWVVKVDCNMSDMQEILQNIRRLQYTFTANNLRNKTNFHT